MGTYFSNLVNTIAIKPSKTSVISYWITELGELENTTKKAMPALKAFLTNNMDSLRKPYAVEETTFTRRTVFAGTVNETGFLSDATGNSRFWVIPVKEFKNTSNINIQQVWAAVKELYESGKQWWLTLEEEQKLEKSNEDYEPENAIADFLEKGLDWETEPGNWKRKTIICATCFQKKHGTSIRYFWSRLAVTAIFWLR
jgi:predicted P-loop ATPase